LVRLKARKGNLLPMNLLLARLKSSMAADMGGNAAHVGEPQLVTPAGLMACRADMWASDTPREDVFLEVMLPSPAEVVAVEASAGIGRRAGYPRPKAAQQENELHHVVI
jgi:hypothetical protein